MKAITERAARWRRVGWFIALWCGGVLAVSLAGYALRLLMNAVYA